MANPSDDHALLRDFVDRHSQLAFAQLVRRHAPLVHSAALRRTRDPHLADDVSQAVFLLLAQRAHTIGPHVVLTGWLYNTARYAGSAARRAADRRRLHEQKAPHPMTPTHPDTDTAPTWSDVAPAVDDAMARLRPADRTAILLRYFENKPVRDVAIALELSDDAAKRRCHRALDKLRRLLRLGNATAPALAILLAANAVHAAPPHLIAAASALPTTTVSPTIATLAQGTLHMMIRAKLKLVAAAAFALAITLGGAQLALSRAQAKPPAAPPPARPLVLPSQFAAGSPRAIFFDAFAAGLTADVAHLRSLLLLDPADAALLDRPVAAQAAFESALKLCFPSASTTDTDLPAAVARFVAVQVQGLNNLIEDTAGDESTVSQPNGLSFLFRKVDGQWKWDLTRKPALEADPLFKRSTVQSRIRLLYTTKKMADAYESATKKLAAGAYPSRPAAILDVRTQSLAGMQQTPPELRPATQALFEPIVPLQTDDYAAVRARFHTHLRKNGPATQPTPLPPTPADATLIDYPSGDLRLNAWLYTPTTPGKHPAILQLHGGFTLEPFKWTNTQFFRDANFVHLMPTLRGEHGQPGSYSDRYDEVDDVLAAAAYLKSLPTVDPDRIFLVGYGDTASTALLAAEASPTFRAVSAISGFHDLLLLSKHGPAGVANFSFDPADPREFEVRSPLAYVASLKCPARLYHAGDEPYLTPTDNAFAKLAREHGQDVTTTTVRLHPKEAALESLRQSLLFFQQHL